MKDRKEILLSIIKTNDCFAISCFIDKCPLGRGYCHSGKKFCKQEIATSIYIEEFGETTLIEDLL